MPRCLLGIGANLGDPAHQIDAALDQLSGNPHIQLQSISRRWVTQPVGGPEGQPAFVNGAALITTDLSAEALLAVLQAVEMAVGRVRTSRWGARRIDLDILLYDEAIVSRPQLHIPHPWFVARRFALGPAAEIAPDMPHPQLGWTVGQLWRHAESTPPRFALIGSPSPQVNLEAASLASAEWIEDVAEAAPPRSAVTGFLQQVDLMDQRVARLQQAGWNAPVSAQPLLAAFCLDESLLTAQATLGDADRQLFEREFAVRDVRVQPPKLIILAAGWMRSQKDAAIVDPETRLVELRRQVVVRGRSPLVEVDSTTPADFVREVAGAITAMG